MRSHYLTIFDRNICKLSNYLFIFSCQNKTSHLNWFWSKTFLNVNYCSFGRTESCLLMTGGVFLDLKHFDFPCSSPNLLRFPNSTGEQIFHITPWFPWKQESELAMVVVIDSKQYSYFFWNTHCRTLFLLPFSPIYIYFFFSHLSWLLLLLYNQ